MVVIDVSSDCEKEATARAAKGSLNKETVEWSPTLANIATIYCCNTSCKSWTYLLVGSITHVTANGPTNSDEAKTQKPRRRPRRKDALGPPAWS